MLLPLYYKLNLTTIYTYLEERFGKHSYKTELLFLLSKTIGAAARLYIVALILQNFVFEAWHIPFELTVCGIIFMIWLYTQKVGLKLLCGQIRFKPLF